MIEIDGKSLNIESINAVAWGKEAVFSRRKRCGRLKRIRLRCRKCLLAGVVTNICPLLTAADAYYRGHNLVAVSDCLGAYEGHELALKYMPEQFAAAVADSSAIMRTLEFGRA
ncbi:MAG: isochorismatase family protein [Candidatus Norongarragalinales archaeon]